MDEVKEKTKENQPEYFPFQQLGIPYSMQYIARIAKMRTGKYVVNLFKPGPRYFRDVVAYSKEDARKIKRDWENQ